MVTVSWPDERPQSAGEEIANSISHGVGLLGALAAFPFLIVVAHRHGAMAVLGAAVFASAAVLLYLMSTLFHALPASRAKRVFQVLDHSAIYFLIAGTYTPFLLGVLKGTGSWLLLGVIWTLALLGTLLKSLGGVRYTAISTWTYLGMGWLVLIVAEKVWALVPAWGLFWLVAGGIAYTAGAVFFMAERIRYFHFIWHLFVVAGTACHFVAVLGYSS